MRSAISIRDGSASPHEKQSIALIEIIRVECF